MHPDLPPPNSQPDSDHLTGQLHDAVEQVRSQPVPAGSRDRALDRARRLRRPRALRWGLALAGLAAAAALMLGVFTRFGIWPTRPTRFGEDQVAAFTIPHNRGGGDPDDLLGDLGENKTRTADPEGDVRLLETVTGRPAKPAETSGSGPVPTSRTSGAAAGFFREAGKADPALPHAETSSTPSTTAPAPIPPAGYAGDNPVAPSGGGGGGAPGMRPPAGPASPLAPGATPMPRVLRPGAPDASRPLDEAKGPYDRPAAAGEPASRREYVRELERLREAAEPALRQVPQGIRLADQWSKLPQAERAKQLEELSKKLPAAQRDAVRGYLESRAREEDKLAKEAKADKDKKEQPAPQVFKRQGPPTVARVYVGDGNSLELVSLHVTVTVEGPRARTLIDHVFRNPHGRQLEGTFEYPLPTGASPSYYAMFLGQTRDTPPPRFVRKGDARAGVQPLPAALAPESPEQLARHVDTTDWGRLQEGRVVSQEKALETYEEVVRGRIDPALLEYAGGNTFRGRVFPIAPRGYNRVLLAYEELLPVSNGTATYRFPLPDGPVGDLRLALHARGPECKNPRFEPADAAKEKGGSWLAYVRTWNGQGPGGDASFRFDLPDPHVQAIAGRQGENGPLYLYARLRPDLQVQEAKPHARHAVFLLDTSLSEHPDRFARSVDLLREILAADPDLAHFNVLTFNVGASWVEPTGWLPNTEGGRRKILDRLDGLILEGATDLGAALARLSRLPGALDVGSPLDVFLLSDGQVTWGDREPSSLAAAFEAACPYATRFHCYRTGLGADNLAVFEALTRKGGGVFNCLTAAEVKPAAVAHRRQCLKIDSVRLVGGPKAEDVLVAGRRGAVYPGGDLVLAARLAAPGRTSVLVEGTFNGQKYAQEFPVEAKADSELAPRGWGELAVASLLALNDPKMEPLAVAYGQQFGIASRAASYLVLENDNDYKRFNLEEERGKTLTGDLGAFLADAWASLGKPVSAREAFTRFLQRIDPRVHLLQDKHVTGLLDRLADADFQVEPGPLTALLLHKGDVPPAYLEARAADSRNVSTYTTEARRRADAGDADGGVRVLSSVIEEHPGRGDALRLVGYRLLDLNQPARAVHLFEQVQRQRPFEPHSYRDLARSLESAGKYGLAAVNYEALLAGTWHNRFGASLKQVALEEYAAMMREAIAKKAVTGKVADHFGDRLENLKTEGQGDLRVSITWNTDGTDVDLWVLEPDGTKVFYSQPRSKSGAQLSQDQTQGYGPERYLLPRASHGTYRVVVHYFRPNPNLLAGETHVQAIITRFAGTPKESVERRTVVLKKHNEEVEICRLEY